MTPITIADPNLALAMTALGILLVALEFCFPGTVIPAAVGGALLLIGIWSIAQGALNGWYAALAAASLGLVAAAGFFAPSALRWPLGAVAAALFGLGLSRMAPEIRWPLAAAAATVLSPLLIWLLSLAALAHRIKTTGETL